MRPEFLTGTASMPGEISRLLTGTLTRASNNNASSAGKLKQRHSEAARMFDNSSMRVASVADHRYGVIISGMRIVSYHAFETIWAAQ